MLSADNEEVRLVLSRTLSAGLLCLLCNPGVPLAAAEEWLPVLPEELQMAAEPQAPGVSAVYLYRQVDRDDNRFLERVYVRTKILTHDGLKYANVEIPFVKGVESVYAIQARTIRPDGTAVNFDGTTFDKTVVRTERVKRLAKTFTLPEVAVGSIVEYRYERSLAYGWVYDSHWILSQDLFTKLAKFSLVPNPRLTVTWSWPRGLPTGTDPPKMEHGKIHLEARNVPAFVSEEYMPPENELRLRVDFIYDSQRPSLKDPVGFWRRHAREIYDGSHLFCEEPKAMERDVAQVAASGDSPEARLRKLYSRIQQIHNLKYAPESEREAQRQQADSIHNVEDVWKRGYGSAWQITMLYLALARAAGVEAYQVRVATRDRYFFDHRLMNATELNSDIVLVKLDDRDLYLDPGVPFTPFGLLPWRETSVEGLQVNKDGVTWLRTPDPAASDSRIERHAAFKFNAGTLEGKVTVTYTGLEAARRRMEERAEDETARRKFLEQDLEDFIPTGINVKLTNSPDWSGWDTPLVAEYDLEIPGWAAPAGRRSLLPVGVFGGAEKHLFEHSSRTHPMYFHYGYQHVDDITIDIPAPWVLDSAPKPTIVDLKGLTFKAAVEKREHSLHVTRELTQNVILVDSKFYDAVRQFYQAVRSADEEQAVLSYGGAAR